jgi:hypothetical protein
MTVHLPDEAEKQRFETAAMQSLHRPGEIATVDPVFMVKNQERIPFIEFMTAHMNKAIPLNDAPDRASVRVANDGWKIEIRGTSPLSFDHADIAFDVHKQECESVVTSGRVAELILSGFGDAEIIIFGDQLERRKINPETGEVI